MSRDERDEIILSALGQINDRLSNLEKGQAELINDVCGLKQDVSGLKQGQESLKKEVETLKEDLAITRRAVAVIEIEHGAMLRALVDAQVVVEEQTKKHSTEIAALKRA